MNERVVIDLRKMGDAAAAAVGGQQRRRRPPPLVALERRHALVRRVRQPEHVAILRRLRLEPPQRARPQLAAAEQEAHEHGAADVLQRIQLWRIALRRARWRSDGPDCTPTSRKTPAAVSCAALSEQRGGGPERTSGAAGGGGGHVASNVACFSRQRRRASPPPQCAGHMVVLLVVRARRVARPPANPLAGDHGVPRRRGVVRRAVERRVEAADQWVIRGGEHREASPR